MKLSYIFTIIESANFEQKLFQAEDFKYDLPITLKDVYYGTTISFTVERKIFKEDLSYTIEKKSLSVPIAKGILAGTEIRISGEGNRYPRQPSGDVVFVARDAKEGFFTRKGANVHYRKRIRPESMSKPLKILVPTPSGSYEIIEIKEGLNPNNYVRRCKGLGLPFENFPEKRVDFLREMVYTVLVKEEGTFSPCGKRACKCHTKQSIACPAHAPRRMFVWIKSGS